MIYLPKVFPAFHADCFLFVEFEHILSRIIVLYNTYYLAIFRRAWRVFTMLIGIYFIRTIYSISWFLNYRQDLGKHYFQLKLLNLYLRFYKHLHSFLVFDRHMTSLCTKIYGTYFLLLFIRKLRWLCSYKVDFTSW